MNNEYKCLLKAYDRYRKAKEALFKFYGATNLRVDGDKCYYSCADCGVDLYAYPVGYSSLPLSPLFHCGKMRLVY